MNELFKEEGQSIFSFKKGDIIIRVESAVIKKESYNENLGITTEIADYTDNSLRKEPVEFIGITNNIIYLRTIKNSPVHYNEKKYLYRLILEHFSEGWAYFKLPEGLDINDL